MRQSLNVRQSRVRKYKPVTEYKTVTDNCLALVRTVGMLDGLRYVLQVNTPGAYIQDSH